MRLRATVILKAKAWPKNSSVNGRTNVPVVLVKNRSGGKSDRPRWMPLGCNYIYCKREPRERSILDRKTCDTGNPARPLADGGELYESALPMECAVLPLWLVSWV